MKMNITPEEYLTFFWNQKDYQNYNLNQISKSATYGLKNELSNLS